jgi:hypothetical protein
MWLARCKGGELQIFGGEKPYYDFKTDLWVAKPSIRKGYELSTGEYVDPKLQPSYPEDPYQWCTYSNSPINVKIKQRTEPSL